MWQPSMPRAAVAALMFATLAVELGCSGKGLFTEQASAVCSETAPTARVRRLTRKEYQSAISDLLGYPVSVEGKLSSDMMVMGFNTNENLVADDTFTDELGQFAEELATSAVSQVNSLLQCKSGQSEEDCVKSFIQSFGKKAFRRPLESSEAADLYALFQAGRSGANLATGVRLVLQGVLQSPQLLYRTELGAASGGNSMRQLTPHETASEMAFLLTGGPPDAELIQAADLNQLATPDQREAHARRLLQSAGAREQIKGFIIQWLGVQNVPNISKESTQFPEFSPELAASFMQETSAFIDEVMANDHSLRTLLSADFTMANSQLASFYGLSSSGMGSSFKRVGLSPERRGILNHGSVLATYSHSNSTSPVRRGKLVRTRLLCQDLPPPPPDVNVTPPPLNPNMTTRERLSVHLSNPSCASCHRRIDPIGFGMEDFDGIGKYRTKENNLPVDASGTLEFVSDQEGPFNGGANLAVKLSQSAEVAACFNVQLFRFSAGRKENTSDICSLDSARAGFLRNGLDIREQLVGLVRSANFTLRSPTPN